VSLSVLLVDDDPAFRWLATQILNDIGAEVVACASDAASAVREAHAARPDAALVDVGLPDRDGVSLAHELAALPWRPRVVLTSSDSDAMVGIEADSASHRLEFVPKAQLPNAPLAALLGANSERP
jgi:DNA-binding NarL/FixJ family response regulator